MEQRKKGILAHEREQRKYVVTKKRKEVRKGAINHRMEGR